MSHGLLKRARRLWWPAAAQTTSACARGCLYAQTPVHNLRQAKGKRCSSCGPSIEHKALWRQVQLLLPMPLVADGPALADSSRRRARVLQIQLLRLACAYLQPMAIERPENRSRRKNSSDLGQKSTAGLFPPWLSSAYAALSVNRVQLVPRGSYQSPQ